jgi:hypothetical protein
MGFVYILHKSHVSLPRGKSDAMKKALLIFSFLLPVIGYAQTGKSLALRIGPSSFDDQAINATTIKNDEIDNTYQVWGLEMEALYTRLHGEQNFFSRYRAGFMHSSFDAKLQTVGKNDGLSSGSSTTIRTAAGLGQKFQWGNISLSLGVDLELAYQFPIKENSAGYYITAQSDTLLEFVSTHDPAKFSTGLSPFVNINYVFAKHFHIGLEFRHPFTFFFVNGDELYSHYRTETNGTVIEESSSTSRIKLKQFITPQIMLPPFIEIGFQW